MTKSNKLTAWIFVALILGVLMGAWLNSSYPPPAQKTYAEAISSLQEKINQEQARTDLSTQLEVILADSTLDEKSKWEKAATAISADRKRNGFTDLASKAVNREESINPTLKSILENITILTDIFLRLIKMIIA